MPFSRSLLSMHNDPSWRSISFLGISHSRMFLLETKAALPFPFIITLPFFHRGVAPVLSFFLSPLNSSFKLPYKWQFLREIFLTLAGKVSLHVRFFQDTLLSSLIPVTVAGSCSHWIVNLLQSRPCLIYCNMLRRWQTY